MEETASARDTTGRAPGRRRRREMLVPGLIVVMVVMYVVSLGGMLMVMPADHDPIHLTKPMVAWGSVAMFESVLVYPVAIVAMLRMRPKRFDSRNAG